MVIAAVGRPTAPIFPPLLEAVKEYWANQTGDSIGYGPLTGIEEHRVRMATALSKSYGVSVSADDVVFTVGGHHAIAASFAAFRSLHPGKKVVVSYPVYPAYSGWSSHENQLVKVDTMPAGGIFSAEALQAALQRESPAEIGMFVFCSPNNPCGYVIAREEWLKIAPILRQYEDSMIMLDEAYMEMSFDPYTSLLSVAPDLHSRIILVRSGTKGFSASGERMAIAGNVLRPSCAAMLCAAMFVVRMRAMVCSCWFRGRAREDARVHSRVDHPRAAQRSVRLNVHRRLRTLGRNPATAALGWATQGAHRNGNPAGGS